MKKFLMLDLTLFIAIALALTPQGRGTDGKYHDPYTGEAQPDMCDNNHNNTHPCECNKADTKCGPGSEADHPNAKCKTFCRPKACTCVNGCSS